MNAEKLIAAGIVTYNSDPERLRENLNAVRKQVGKVYVFDNGSGNIAGIEELCGADTGLIRSGRNEGIACALNRLFEAAEKDGYKWLLTLDQDSVCLPCLTEIYQEHLQDGDSFTTLRKDVNMQSGDREDNRIQETDRCITSGNLVKIEAWRQVGGFNERLFIDMVDIDFCFRLKAAGRKIIKIGRFGFYHEMGDGTSIRVLGKKVYIGNYSAFRKYYIARNMVYVIRKYHLRGDYYSYKRLFVLFMHALLREKDKLNRCKSFLRGIRDGFSQFAFIDSYFDEQRS